MAFAEDLAIFFNPDEFGTLATINGKVITGFFSYGYLLVNEVEMCKPIFTCAEANIASAYQGLIINIQQQSFQIISVKPDGFGCITLVLERLM